MQPGPENTPEAVRAALAAGADGCEVDVRCTADGVLVCHHDPVRRRRALIRTHSDDLVAAGVPWLSDIIAAAGTRRLVIEVKNRRGDPDFTADGTAAQLLVRLLGRLSRYRSLANVLVSSFDPVSLEVAKTAGWPVGLLTRPGVSVAEGLSYASAAGYQELHSHVSAFNGWVPERGTSGWDAGLRLVAWTVTSIEQASWLQEQGVDAVICDDPAAVAAALSGSSDGRQLEDA